MPFKSNPRLSQIVSKHLQNWEIRQRIERRQRHDACDPRQVGPYISISRQPFSHGTEVARRTAEMLGWQCFNRRIVDFVAHDANTLSEFVHSVDEKCRKSMDDYIQTTLDTSALGHVEYLRHLRRVLMTLAAHGQVVILGRGANFILPRKRGLRVLLTSKFRHRAQRLMEGKGLPRSDAEVHLRQLDKQRDQFLKTHFNIDPADVTQNLDMILNMDCMTIEQAATIIASSARELKPLQARVAAGA